MITFDGLENRFIEEDLGTFCELDGDLNEYTKIEEAVTGGFNIYALMKVYYIENLKTKAISIFKVETYPNIDTNECISYSVLTDKLTTNKTIYDTGFDEEVNSRVDEDVIGYFNIILLEQVDDGLLEDYELFYTDGYNLFVLENIDRMTKTYETFKPLVEFVKYEVERFQFIDEEAEIICEDYDREKDINTTIEFVKEAGILS